MFWTALRRWAERAVSAGIVTIDDIKNGDPAACTLLLEAISGAPQGRVPPQPVSPVASCADTRFAAQHDLERLMARAIAMRRR
jgi:hypothetical protein